MSSPTLDWERVGDSFYRKVKLYEAIFDHDLELENYVAAGAPYGGAIGIRKAILLSWVRADLLQPCTAMKTSYTHIEEIKPPKPVLTSTAARAS